MLAAGAVLVLLGSALVPAALHHAGLLEARVIARDLEESPRRGAPPRQDLGRAIAESLDNYDSPHGARSADTMELITLGRDLPIRMEPSLDRPVAGILKVGDQVIVVSRQGAWVQLFVQDRQGEIVPMWAQARDFTGPPK